MQIAHAVKEAVRAKAGTGRDNEDHCLTTQDIFQRVGLLTRRLHDTLRELGYDKDVEAAVGALPDARARLDYVAQLTGKAADRVLDATERAKSLVDKSRADADALHKEWATALAGDASAIDWQTLGRRTKAHLDTAQQRDENIGSELCEIMMAQDFHDLTGQIIQRVTRLAQSLEDQLLRLLFDVSTPEQRKELLINGLAGPVINGEGRDDVVTGQGQVDDLLDSLGF